MKELCFDISTWQGGIDYNAIKARTNYCILRAGFSTTIDNEFEEHYKNLKDINLGAYWYSYAESPDEAREEARKFLEVIKGKQFTLPLFLDLEDPSISGLGRATLNEIVTAFGSVIENAGYYFGVYTNLNWYRNVISGYDLNKKYDWWIACWSDTAPSNVNYGIWQFTSNYDLNGTRVDANYITKDYPTIIRESGLNHLSDIKYRAHIEGIGWQEWKTSGETAGTTGESRRLEAIEIDYNSKVEAMAHIEGIGWVDYGEINKDSIIGTVGESRRLECLRFKGNFKYRVHIEGTGWSCWTQADGICTLGSVGQSLRIEAIEILEL